MINGGDAFRILGSLRFLPLFICQFLAAFGDTFIRTAMVTLVTFMSNDLSDMARSLIITLALGLFMAPYIFFSATGGQLCDKYNKARVIQIIKFFSITIGIVGIMGFYMHSYIILLAAIFLTGLDSAFFGPAKYSILPDHLERKDLLIANGLIEAGTFIAILLGMIMGGVIISQQGSGMTLNNFFLLFISVGCFVATIFIPNTEPAAPDIKLDRNFFRETIACVQHTRKDKELFLAIHGISWFWMIGGLLMSQMPNLTKDTLNGDNSVYILLMTLFSIGTGIGSILCNKLLKGQIDTQYVPISMLAMTFFLGLLWVCSIYFPERESLGGVHYFLSSIKGVLVCVSVLMVAIAGGIYIVPLYALLQVRSKRQYRSRVIATNNIMNAVYIVIASIISMAMLAIGVSVSSLLFVMTLVNLFTAILICRILPDTVIKAIFQAFFRLFFRVEIVGLENYYKAGKRVLIISNHASFIDPPLLGAFLPDRLVFAIDTFHSRSWWLNPFLSYLRAYPIDPTNAMATKTLIEQLKQDNPVVIFPEGRITVTGSLMKIYEGPGLVADRAGAKLLPIRIDGAQYSPFSRLHGKVKLRLFPKIKITIMEPQEIKVDSAIVGRHRRHLIGKQLYDIMSKMMFEGSEYYNQTLFDSVISAHDQHGKNFIAIEDADKTKLTYQKLILASFLLGKKMKKYTSKKENVGVFLPNVAGVAPTFFGLQIFGRVPAMLNYSTGIKNLINCCKAAEIKTIFTAHKFIDKANFHHIIDALQENGIKIIYLEDVRKNISFIDKIWALISSYFPQKTYKKIKRVYGVSKASDPAVILFTSGSEGLPKGVVLSHSNIQANIKQAASRVDFSPHDILFNALPVFHSFGLTGGFLLPLISGVKTVFYPSPLHYRIIPEVIYGTNATILFGTDTFLSGYAKHAHPYDFYSVRYIFAGAEKLREETRKTYSEKFGIRIMEGYGATEAAPVIAVNTPMHYKAGTVGRFIPNIDYYLEPVEGIEQGGRLIVSGPNVMLGYLKADKPGVIQKPEHKINGKNRKNWYDTGDIVDVDEDGFVKILGRAKRFAKIGGEMISLTVIEENISPINKEHLAATINLPDAKKGEVIILFTNNQALAREEILKHFKKIGLSELFVPRIVRFIQDIPVLATGKIDYVSLKEIAEKVDLSSVTNDSEED